jgi:acyl-CoA dehydrogenase
VIGFELDERQLALQEAARKFAEQEMKPVAAAYDQGHEFAWDVMKKAFQAGFLSCSVPAEYGGGGLMALDTAIVSEELAVGCAGLFTSMMANSLALTPVILFGTEEQKKKYLTPFTEKPVLAAFCLTEREAGSDAGSVKTTAAKDASGYVINGAKCFITNGGVASLHVVFASTDREKGTRGMSAFIVPADTKGVHVGKVEDKMGQRASNTSEVFFDDVRVPKENLLAKEGLGFVVAMKTLDKARASVGAAGVGVARAAYEYCINYTKTRKQFGKPISSFQHLAFKLADMAMEINAARHLVWHAAWLLDEGKKASKESAFAKCFASDVAMRTTVEAVQILGGYGYMRDYPMEKLMRDAKLLQIYEGTNEIQRLVISHEILS